MTFTLKRIGLLPAGAFIFAAGLMWNGETSPSTITDLYSKADAVIGRPLTPVSVAGVARRTTRRAIRRGAVYGAYPVAPGPVVVEPYPPTCVTVIDSYGRSYERCP